jgi:asparagine synthase (glutamine-hydrolysing)
LDALYHRGPDAGAEETIRIGDWYVQLGHRRLSIVDLSSAANQPFHGGRGGTIVFNGEIYNHGALREALSRDGRRFRTRSDTEVLLAGIEDVGSRFLPILNGMYAFAMVDSARGRLLLGRDPFGIKPLYFARLVDGGIAFASELRALAFAASTRLMVDSSCLAEFLLNGFLYEPRTGFIGMEKVQSGTCVEVDLLDQEIRLNRQRIEAGSGAGDFAALVERQLKLEVEADVPVGVFFSGGIDSSVLVAAAPRSVSAFYVDYGGTGGAEGERAKAVANKLGVTMHRAICRESEATDVIDEFRIVARGTEEPISDFTYFATRLIARHAREAGYKVMLSGMGGDELFAGYPRYQAARYWNLLSHFEYPLKSVSGALRRFPGWSKKADRLISFVGASEFPQAYTSLVGYFSEAEVGALLGTADGCERFFAELRKLLAPVKGYSLVRQAMALDRHGFLAHNLTVTDRASMAESIEVRVPLLSPDLAAWAARAEDCHLIQNGRGKQPLRSYLRRSLPHGLVDTPKVGFNPPMDRRIRSLGRDGCLDLLTQGNLTTHLDGKPIRAWIDEHFSGTRNHTFRLWQLIYLELWLDEMSVATQ